MRRSLGLELSAERPHANVVPGTRQPETWGLESAPDPLDVRLEAKCPRRTPPDRPQRLILKLRAHNAGDLLHPLEEPPGELEASPSSEPLGRTARSA